MQPMRGRAPAPAVDAHPPGPGEAPTPRVRHPIHLAVRPVSTVPRPAPPSLFVLQARPRHDGFGRPPSRVA